MAKKISKSKDVNENLSLSKGKTISDKIIKVKALNDEQREALKSIHENQVTFLIGKPGTGKTYCAVGYGLQEMIRGNFDRIIFTRPYVEAGEKLGYLPGSFDAKTAPFMIPMYEVVRDFFGEDDIREMIEERKIVVLPFAYMRGVNFRKAYVVTDEAQNATPQQMHLLLTRICDGSKVVVTGDVYQSDLRHQMNGLTDAIKKLKGINGLNFMEMTYESCVRAKIVQDIDARYRDSHPGSLGLNDIMNNINNIKTLDDLPDVRPHVDERRGVLFDD